MKIAFRIDCNEGLGRFLRCSALAAELTKRGCECVFFCNGDVSAFSAAAPPGSIEFLPKLSITDELALMQDKMLSFDAIIIDANDLSDTYIASLNRLDFTVICCDDNSDYNYSCDIVINGNLYANGLSFNFGDKRPKLLLGRDYTLLREEFCNSPPIEIRDRAYKIFICLGNSDSRAFTPSAIYALSDLPGIELTVVLGAMSSCDDSVQKLAAENVHVHKNPPSIANLMRTCDLAVVSAGNLMYELGALGIPAFTLVQSENRRILAQFFERNGLMKCIGDWQMADLGILRSDVDKFIINYARRQCESRDLTSLISRSGSQNTAAALLEHIQSLR